MVASRWLTAHFAQLIHLNGVDINDEAGV